MSENKNLGHNSNKDFLKKPVEHIDITSFDSRKIISSMEKMSFVSRETANAANIYNEMLKDKDCTIFLTLAGSTSAAGCMNIFWAKDKSKWDLRKFKKLIKNKTVYLTFDVDGFDSSIMPATGTPEPGGLLWDETLNIIKIAAKNSNIVGADINELAPIKGFNSYNFLVAKLAYKILSYKFLI